MFELMIATLMALGTPMPVKIIAPPTTTVSPMGDVAPDTPPDTGGGHDSTTPPPPGG